jgi:hypothetical protein
MDQKDYSVNSKIENIQKVLRWFPCLQATLKGRLLDVLRLGDHGLMVDAEDLLKLWAQLEYAVAGGGEGGCGQNFMYNKEEALVMAETNKYANSFRLWY